MWMNIRIVFIVNLVLLFSERDQWCVAAGLSRSLHERRDTGRRRKTRKLRSYRDDAIISRQKKHVTSPHSRTLWRHNRIEALATIVVQGYFWTYFISADLWLIHTTRDRDRDRDWETKGSILHYVLYTQHRDRESLFSIEPSCSCPCPGPSAMQCV